MKLAAPNNDQYRPEKAFTLENVGDSQEVIARLPEDPTLALSVLVGPGDAGLLLR